MFFILGVSVHLPTHNSVGLYIQTKSISTPPSYGSHSVSVWNIHILVSKFQYAIFSIPSLSLLITSTLNSSSFPFRSFDFFGYSVFLNIFIFLGINANAQKRTLTRFKIHSVKTPRNFTLIVVGNKPTYILLLHLSTNQFYLGLS
jgi:hypothetical protein